MKKRISILLATLLLLCLLSLSAFATEENDISKIQLPKPQTPNYFMYIDGNGTDGRADELRMIMVADRSVIDLTSEWDSDSDAFYEKYGLYHFNAYMQYDISLDGEDNWQYTSEWDSQYYVGSYDEGFQSSSLRSELMEEFGFFDLYFYEGPDTDTFKAYRPALTSEKYYWGDGYEKDVYSFDTANHNLYIRCRYYIEWETYDGETVGDRQSKVSEWSDSAVFGRNSTQVVPEEPTVYEAPVISDLSVKLADIGNRRLELDYVQTTPESVWLTNIYYMMKGEGSFDGLETQVSIDGSDWISFSTYDSGDDWCLWDGIRTAGADDVTVKDTSHIKLRIRFLGTHGPSEWSNVLEINKPAEEEHDYALTIQEATCLKDGLKTYTCLCGDTYTEVIPKLPHEISEEYTIDVPATCAKEGSKSKHCINGCDMKEDVTAIPRLSHIYETEYTVDVQPTCSKEGSKSRHCTNNYCDAKTDVTAVEILPHKYSTKYTVDVQPTCTKSGSKSRHCENYGCDAKTAVTAVEKLPHPLRDYLTKATLSKNGKIVTKCHVCGYVSKTETVYYPETVTLSTTKFVYNGKQKTPKLIIKDSKGKELLNSVDYIYSMPEKRTEIGKYTVEVTFKGNYSGEKKLTFTIVPDVTSKITATQTLTSVTLKWSKVPKADGYRVYVYNTKTKEYEKVKDVTGTELKITGLKAGTGYAYRIRAYTDTKKDGRIWGDYSKTFETATKCKAPTLSAAQTTKTITLKWSKVKGADGYRVYKYNSKTKKYEKLKDVTGTSLKITKLSAGKKYKFKVRAYTKADGTIWGDYSKVFETATKCKTPKITKLTTTKGKASFTWSDVSGESGYEVYYSTKKGSGYKKAASYKTNVVKGSKSKLKSGKKYYFKVRAYKTVDGKKIYSAWSAVKSVKIK